MANEIPSMDVPPHVLEYIHEQKTMTLATSSPGAVPLATTLVYVDDGSALYVWTRPDTTTAQHMGQNPLVSFAIDEYASDWQQT
jgi:nitroimidazol reductase NimA-like FMN-containing flavoprotein (pyridoxamine 5'-phosphate oxidase superfamily)